MMMKNLVNIPIRRTTSSIEDGVNNQSGFPRIETQNYFDLARYCLDHKMSPTSESEGVNDTSFYIQCDENHPSLSSVMEMLSKWGWDPVPRLLTHDTPEFGYFPLSVMSSFEKRDLESAKHLCLETWGSISVRFPILRDEKREICGYDAKGMSGRWSHDFLDVEGLGEFAVSVVGREILESAGLRGIVFREIEWDFPKKVKRPFYIVDCERKMPLCLLPVVKEKNWNQTGWYLDGPYEPHILQFSKAQMNCIDGVDVASTVESLRPNPKLAAASPRNHSLIISARFREVLKNSKVKHTATPVKWVDGSKRIDRIPPFLPFVTLEEWQASIV